MHAATTNRDTPPHDQLLSYLHPRGVSSRSPSSFLPSFPWIMYLSALGEVASSVSHSTQELSHQMSRMSGLVLMLLDDPIPEIEKTASELRVVLQSSSSNSTISSGGGSCMDEDASWVNVGAAVTHLLATLEAEFLHICHFYTFFLTVLAGCSATVAEAEAEAEETEAETEAVRWIACCEVLFVCLVSSLQVLEVVVQSTRKRTDTKHRDTTASSAGDLFHTLLHVVQQLSCSRLPPSALSLLLQTVRTSTNTSTCPVLHPALSPRHQHQHQQHQPQHGEQEEEQERVQGYPRTHRALLDLLGRLGVLSEEVEEEERAGVAGVDLSTNMSACGGDQSQQTPVVMEQLQRADITDGVPVVNHDVEQLYELTPSPTEQRHVKKKEEEDPDCFTREMWVLPHSSTATPGIVGAALGTGTGTGTGAGVRSCSNTTRTDTSTNALPLPPVGNGNERSSSSSGGGGGGGDDALQVGASRVEEGATCEPPPKENQWAGVSNINHIITSQFNIDF